MPEANSIPLLTPSASDPYSDALKRRILAAQLLQRQAADQSQPVYGKNLGVAKLGAGLLGGLMEGYEEGKARSAEKEGYKALLDVMYPKQSAASITSAPGPKGSETNPALASALMPESPEGLVSAPTDGAQVGNLISALTGRPETADVPDQPAPVQPAPIVAQPLPPLPSAPPQMADNRAANFDERFGNWAPASPNTNVAYGPTGQGAAPSAPMQPVPMPTIEPPAQTVPMPTVEPRAQTVPMPNANQGGGLNQLFAAKEKEYGLPEGYLSRTAQIESSMNPRARNPNSSAGGLFQFIDKTAAAYGLRDRFDPIQSTDAAARLARDNMGTLRQQLGREPTAAELYLAHQQGATGASRILQNPNAQVASLVGGDAAALNGGGGMSSQQFANKWTSRFDQPQASQAMAQGQQAAPQQTAMPAPQQQSFPPQTPRNGVSREQVERILSSDAPAHIKQAILQQIGPGQLKTLKEGEILYRQTPSGGIETVNVSGQGYRPATVDEKKAAGIDPNYPMYFGPGGKPIFGQPGMNVQVSADKDGAELMAKKGIEGFDNAQKVAVDANRRIAGYGQMAQAMQGFKPGATADIKLRGKALLKDMGIIDDVGVSSAEAFKATQRRLELASTPKAQGQITENERILIRDTLPSITNSPEGIVKTIDMLKRLDEYDIKVANIWRESARASRNGVPNYLAVSDQIAKLGPPLQDSEIAALNAMKPREGQSNSPSAPQSRPRARNPQTGAVIEFDGQGWVPVQ